MDSVNARRGKCRFVNTLTVGNISKIHLVVRADLASEVILRGNLGRRVVIWLLERTVSGKVFGRLLWDIQHRRNCHF